MTMVAYSTFFWKHLPRLLWPLVAALACVVLFTACGGGGGGPAPATTTTISGTVHTISESALSTLRAASGPAVLSPGRLTPATGGTVTLVSVDTAGNIAAVHHTGTDIQNDGSFSFTVPASLLSQPRLMVKETKVGLSALVHSTAGLKVDPVSTLVTRRAVTAGFAGVDSDWAKGQEAAVRQAWEQRPIALNEADLNTSLGTLLRHLDDLDGCNASAVRALVHAGVGASGSLGEVCWQNGVMTARVDLFQVSTDLALHAFGNKVYTLNRGQSQLFPNTNDFTNTASDALWVMNATTLSKEQEISLQDAGGNTHPEGFAVVHAQKVYITLFDQPSLLVLDLTKHDGSTTITNNAAHQKTLNLAHLNHGQDGDGSPELGEMLVHSGRAYVGMDRASLQNGRPTAVGNGAIAIIDTITDTQVDADPATAGVQAVEMPGQSCQPRHVDITANLLYVTCAGDHYPPAQGSTTATPNTATDGLYTVDLTTLQPTLLLSNQTAGGKIIDYLPVSTTVAYVRLLDQVTQRTTVKAFDPATHTLGDTLFEGRAGEIQVDAQGNVWVAARGNGNGDADTHGLTVLAPGGSSLLSQPQPVNAPPGDFVFLP